MTYEPITDMSLFSERMDKLHANEKYDTRKRSQQENKNVHGSKIPMSSSDEMWRERKYT